MGYNAHLVILNDRLDEIERDPSFGRQVSDAIQTFGYGYGTPYITGQTQVISVHHADNAPVILGGANTARVIGWGWWSYKPSEIVRFLYQELQDMGDDEFDKADRVRQMMR